jgi:hypothetical protein
MCYGNRKELLDQFTDVRGLRPQLAKPVMHVSLSFDATDRLDPEKLRQIGRDFAGEFGFEKNQYVSILHRDTNHTHFHIIANRVGFDGERISDSQNYKKTAEICRKLELKYELKPVLSPRLFLRQKERLIPRQDQRRESLKDLIRGQLLEARNFQDFKERMEAQRIEVIKGRGIAFRDEKKVYVKGSDLGYSLAAIDKILSYSLEQRQQLKLTHDLARGQRLERIERPGGQKEKQFSRSHLRDSRQNRNHQQEQSLSIGENINAKRLLEELLRPELQPNIDRELVRESEKKRRLRQRRLNGF